MMLICSSHNLYIGWKVHKLCIAGNKQSVHKKRPWSLREKRMRATLMLMIVEYLEMTKYKVSTYVW